MMRFPELGVAGRRLVVVVLVGGCNSLTNAPPAFHDGGRDTATHDGARPVETGRSSDGAGGNKADSGVVVAVDAQLDDVVGGVRDNAAGPALGLDAAGGFGGAAGTGGGGGTAGVTGDASPAPPDTNIPADDGSASKADGLVVVDVAVNDQNEVLADGPGESVGRDSSIPSVDGGIVDTAQQPDVARTPVTVNAGPDQTVCDGWQATIGTPAQGGTRPYTYAWSANPTCSGCITNPTSVQTDVVPSATTTFTVTAHDSLSAVATDSVTVTVVDAIADAGPDVSVDLAAPIRIGTPAQPGYAYAWSCDRPTCALSSATPAQPTVSPRLSTTYTVAVTSPEGCIAGSSTTVWVNLPVSTTPKDGEPAYPASASLLVQFGASVLASSITADTLNLAETSSGTPVVFTYAYNPSLHVLTITPTGANYNATVAQYTLTLAGGAAGILSDDPVWPQRLPDNVSIRFTLAATPDLTGPTIVSRGPTSFSTGVPTNTSVVVTYSETLDPTTVTAANFALSTGPTNVAGTLSYDGKTSTIVFVPAAPLATLTTYTVRVSGIRDLSGNTAFTTTWNFTTGRAADTTPPTVIAVTPASGATRVSASPSVGVTFSESIDPTTLAAGIQMAAGANPVVGSVTCDAANQVATFTPSALLASQTLYTVTVAGVKDLAGNAMTAAFTSTFTTTSILFADSFESGTAKWTLAQPPGQPSWGLTTGQYVSASHSLTDSPGGNYLANVNTSATSVVIDVTNVPSVSLGYWLSGQTQPGTDFLRAEYSTNGSLWTTLDTWSGLQNWAQHSRTIALTPGTTSLQIRFRLTSNANQQFDGMYVDDVIVQAL